MSKFIEFLYSKFLLSDGVSIDTRTIEKGNLFFGLNGPNFKGSQYAEKALEMGASYAVVDDPELPTKNDKIIYTEDALKALQDLAIFHRSKFRGSVLAITGSNGKTTTKELTREVLAKKYIVHATEGNYNNHIGVPLTILHLYPQVEIAIIEMGANHVGEIMMLCELANPTHGLITNIGKAHTESFGGIEGVLRGKSELFDYLNKNDGQVFINYQDERLQNMAKRFRNAVKFPSEDIEITSGMSFLSYSDEGKAITTQLVGDYNFGNVAAAISVGRFFGVANEEITTAIEDYVPDNGRSQILEKGKLKIILDAYNANPDSMKVALMNLAKLEGEKLAILGGMNELSESENEHAEIGKLVRSLELPAVFIGEKMLVAKQKSPKSKWVESKEEVPELVGNIDAGNLTILLKASRSEKLETIVDKLTG